MAHNLLKFNLQAFESDSEFPTSTTAQMASQRKHGSPLVNMTYAVALTQPNFASQQIEEADRISGVAQSSPKPIAAIFLIGHLKWD